jgi:hypothetical protein
MNAPLAMLVLISALLQAPTTGVRVSGRVVDGETGKPLADAVVTLLPRGGNDPRPPQAVRSIPVKTDGTFEFTNVPRGAYKLQAEHSKPITPYRSESLDLDITTRNLEDLGMILSPALSKVPVTGKVVLPRGASLVALGALTLAADRIPLQSDGSFEVRMRPMEKYPLVLPAGYYVESISAGQWDSSSGLWMLRDKPASAVQINVGLGQRQLSGRILTSARTPALQATVTLLGPAPTRTSQPVNLGAGGTFTALGVRPGDYELRAQTGSGEALQTAVLPVTMGTQNREGVEVVLKGLTSIKGQVVVSGRTLEELMRFKPVVVVTDTTGNRQVAIDSKGNFEFKSFEGAFTVQVRDLPIEFRVQSVSLEPGSVTVRIGAYSGDNPEFFRFNPIQPK